MTPPDAVTPVASEPSALQRDVHSQPLCGIVHRFRDQGSFLAGEV